MFNHL